MNIKQLFLALSARTAEQEDASATANGNWERIGSQHHNAVSGVVKGAGQKQVGILLQFKANCTTRNGRTEGTHW